MLLLVPSTVKHAVTEGELRFPTVSLVSGACRSFLAACRVATAKLAVNLEGKVDLARLSPWMAAFTAGLLLDTWLVKCLLIGLGWHLSHNRTPVFCCPFSVHALEQLADMKLF